MTTAIAAKIDILLILAANITLHFLHQLAVFNVKKNPC